jgi:hypothetical protein
LQGAALLLYCSCLQGLLGLLAVEHRSSSPLLAAAGQQHRSKAACSYLVCPARCWQPQDSSIAAKQPAALMFGFGQTP